MVDNRYTGVGYDPPFETPSCKDFMEAHIESLQVELLDLQAERDDLKRQLEKCIEENESGKREYAELEAKYNELLKRLEAE